MTWLPNHTICSGKLALSAERCRAIVKVLVTSTVIVSGTLNLTTAGMQCVWMDNGTCWMPAGVLDVWTQTKKPL